jgi:hypothetical protein
LGGDSITNVHDSTCIKHGPVYGVWRQPVSPGSCARWADQRLPYCIRQPITRHCRDHVGGDTDASGIRSSPGLASSTTTALRRNAPNPGDAEKVMTEFLQHFRDEGYVIEREVGNNAVAAVHGPDSPIQVDGARLWIEVNYDDEAE